MRTHYNSQAKPYMTATGHQLLPIMMLLILIQKSVLVRQKKAGQELIIIMNVQSVAKSLNKEIAYQTILNLTLMSDNLNVQTVPGSSRSLVTTAGM